MLQDVINETRLDISKRQGETFFQDVQRLNNGVWALHAPVNTLNANWAYVVMAALAWNLKAWPALLLPDILAGKVCHIRASSGPISHSYFKQLTKEESLCLPESAT